MTDNAFVWMNGQLAPADRLAVSVFDRGLTVGAGVFETILVIPDARGGRHPFALDRHLQRLHRSATGIGLALPHSDDELRAAVRAVLVANGAAAGRVRITVTAGAEPSGPAPAVARPTVIVVSAPGRDWPPVADVAIVPWRRNEHSPVAGLKTTSYAENVVALAYAHEHGADEAILANTAGALCEGAGSNVFVGIGGRLVTPPLSSGCLGGVTRELLLEITAATEEDVAIEALATADEVFITSSTRSVHPVRTVDGVALPACPGPLTRTAAAAFAALLAHTLDP